MAAYGRKRPLRFLDNPGRERPLLVNADIQFEAAKLARESSGLPADTGPFRNASQSDSNAD